MPAHDASATIGSSLRSVLHQTHYQLDIIVVDDGSTDATAAVVEAIAEKDGRVRLLRQANAGVAAARNRGIEEAKADLIAFIDADDLWHPAKIERQLAVLNCSGDRVAVIYTWSCFIDASDHLDGRSYAPSDSGDVYTALVLHNIVGNGSTALVRKRCLTECGGFDANLRARQAQGCEDLKLWLCVAENYDFAVVPAFLVGYRQNAGSMSRRVHEMMRSYTLVINEVKARHPEIPACVFRWSRAKFSFYLAENCAISGRRWLASFLWLKALGHDPMMLASLRFRRVRARLRRTLRLAVRADEAHRQLIGQTFPVRESQEFAEWLARSSVGIERRRRIFVAGVHIHRDGGHAPMKRRREPVSIGVADV
jgi:glycosyltransferase involved in cell wall biosynthesis